MQRRQKAFLPYMILHEYMKLRYKTNLQLIYKLRYSSQKPTKCADPDGNRRTLLGRKYKWLLYVLIVI